LALSETLAFFLYFTLALAGAQLYVLVSGPLLRPKLSSHGPYQIRRRGGRNLLFLREGATSHSTAPEPQTPFWLLLVGGRPWLIIIICAFYISVFYCATSPGP